MAKIEKAIFTNLCMVYDGKGNILVQDRKNPNWKGVTFPGGHVEEGESFTESVIREVREETGLTIENPILCGVKQFPTLEGERYVVFCYKTGTFSGEIVSSSEGEVFWISRRELENYKVAPDFLELIRIFESDCLSEFYLWRDQNAQEYQKKIY
ncbi:MAG: 8-oxo-dGTP diphosphatase [Clostridia bacterium]|nr:8-oxo-dGTP diphosphatase [Clostridia bacterium]